MERSCIQLFGMLHGVLHCQWRQVGKDSCPRRIRRPAEGFRFEPNMSGSTALGERRANQFVSRSSWMRMWSKIANAHRICHCLLPFFLMFSKSHSYIAVYVIQLQINQRIRGTNGPVPVPPTRPARGPEGHREHLPCVFCQRAQVSCPRPIRSPSRVPAQYVGFVGVLIPKRGLSQGRSGKEG